MLLPVPNQRCHRLRASPLANYTLEVLSMSSVECHQTHLSLTKFTSQTGRLPPLRPCLTSTFTMDHLQWQEHTLVTTKVACLYSPLEICLLLDRSGTWKAKIRSRTFLLLPGRRCLITKATLCPYIHHPGQHGHQPGHPGAPPMVGPGPYMFNPYSQPEGRGSGIADNHPPFPQDLPHMHMMHPPAPIWVNPAQPPYGPWAIPMPPYQAHPHHPVPSSYVPQDMIAPAIQPPSQHQEAPKAKPFAPQHVSRQTSPQAGDAGNVTVRLPSTSPEPTGETVERSLKTYPQSGTGVFTEGMRLMCDRPISASEVIRRNTDASSDEAPVSLDATMVEQLTNQQLQTPAICKEVSTVCEGANPGIEDEANKGRLPDNTTGSEGKSGDPAIVARASLCASPEIAGSTSSRSTVASSSNPLPQDLQPVSQPRQVSQDIRLDPDFQEQMNTVIRHKPNHQSRLPSQWMTPHHSNGYSQPSSHEEYHIPINGPREYGAYPVMVDYNVPFVYQGFQSPPVPPPMESSVEIHDFLYGGLFPHPPIYGYSAGEGDGVSQNLNPVYDQHVGEAGQPIGKTKAKRKTKAKKKGVGSRSRTPSVSVNGGQVPQSNDLCIQNGRVSSANGELGDAPVNRAETGGVADANATEPKQKGKKNKPKKTLLPSEGACESLETPAAPECTDLGVETQVQPSQHAEAKSASSLQTAVEGIEDKMGVLRVSKKSRGKAGVSHLENLFLPENEIVKTVAIHTDKSTNHERTSSKDINPHGSFTGLPTSFDPWPRLPNLQSSPKAKSALPKVVVRSPDTSNPAPAILADTLHVGLHMKRPSGASHRTNDSFFTAASRLSSRENTPPSNDESPPTPQIRSECMTKAPSEWHASPPITPTIALPISLTDARIDTPSTAMLSGDASPPPRTTMGGMDPSSGGDGNDAIAAPMINTDGPQPLSGPVMAPETLRVVVGETTTTAAGEETTGVVKTSKSKKKKNKKKQQQISQHQG
ncbi:hypothetical protein B0T16DRAFT_18834 [Cercophora newfieldiana]|uniref:Uncharacterized protein n=1 Tax=Cercophora newfieldiana TaxID=92897 RepID=A0AA39YR21_9PEZI|nr:hypothetical protein B0T16DRAFT_18834 [Cercophora newfieldiana]